MAFSDNEFLARGATSGSYDLPNYGVGAIVRAVTGKARRPRGGGGRSRGTRELLEEGQRAVPEQETPDPDALAETLTEVSAKQTPETPIDTAAPDSAGAPGDTDPLGVVPKTQEEGKPALTQTEGPSVKDIVDTRERADVIESRTWERNINLDYIQDADQIGATLEATAAKLDLGLDEPYSFDQLRKDVDGNHMEIFAEVLKENPQALSQQQLLAGREIMLTLSKLQDDLATKIAENKATPEEILQFDKITDQAAMVMNYMQGKIRESARALNSMKVVAQTINTFDPARIAQEAKHVNAQERAQMLVDMKKAGASADERIQKGAEMSRLKKATAALVNMRSAGLLTGFKTNTVNLFNNAFMGGLRTLAVKPVAAAVGRVTKGPGGDRVYLAEVQAEVAGTVHGFIDALSMAIDTWKTGTFTNKGEYVSPFGGRKIDEVTEDVGHFGTALTELVEEGGKAGQVAGKVIRATRADKAVNAYHRTLEPISFGLLTAGDDFYKAMHYRKSLYAQAVRIAKREGLEGKALVDRSNELLNNVTHKMHSEAMREAEIQTFTNREDVGRVLNLVSNAATKLGNEWPLFRWWAPFIRTPVSIIDRTIKMSPAAPLQESYKQRIARGGPDADMARAEMIVGTAITSVLGMLVSMGLLTGNGPSHRDDPTGSRRNVLRASGWQPNSVLVDGKYVSLKRGFDPVMVPALGIAHAVDAARYAGTESDAWDYIGGASLVAAQTFVDNTFLQGVNDLFDLVSGRVNYKEYTGKQGGSMVPSILRDFNNIMRYSEGEVGRPVVPKSDDLALSMIYNIATRVPGMDPPAEARYWDGTIATPGGGDLMFTWNTLTPIMSSWEHGTKGREFDPETEALVTNGVGVSQPKADITLHEKSGYSVNLIRDIPNGNQLYGLLLETVGNWRRQYVSQVVNSSGYQQLVEEKLTGPNSWAAIMLDKAIRRGLIKGREEFMEKINDPSFAWEDYGIVDPEAEAILKGERLQELMQMHQLDALTPEETGELQEGGFRGLPTRAPIELPRGDYIPNIK